MLFGALGMSLNRLAALLHSDPGTVSRYLSGKRIPPKGFIDGLCKAVYNAKGSVVTEQVHQLVHEQFLAALRAHNPARYEVQRLTDLLQVAAQEKRRYEITVAALEEAKDQALPEGCCAASAAGHGPASRSGLELPGSTA